MPPKPLLTALIGSFGPPAAADTKVYELRIAHADQEARDANFNAFRGDPDWVAVRDASEKDGAILIKDGVKSVLLKPTDYSPTQK